MYRAALLSSCPPGSKAGTHHQSIDCGEEGQRFTELYTWGRNANHQLAWNATAYEVTVPHPVALPAAIEVRSVACGHAHTAAVTRCGSIFVWGLNSVSRLGLCSAADGMPVKAAVEPAALAEFGPGRILATKAVAGPHHTLALTDQGKIFAWGLNSKGQLGLQGVPVEEDAHVPRPTVLKATFRNEAVRDIAAGLEHSLCCTSAGAVYSWGSNAFGALGLGAPPAGPALTQTPKLLPHLQGITAVFASALGHVSVALAAHGDALVFGAPNRGPAPDTKAFLPSRVRRRGHNAGAEEEEEWQTQRAPALATASGPLQSIALGQEEAFGVDAAGTLWSWQLAGARPCCAHPVRLRWSPSDHEAMLLAEVAFAGRAGVLWARDASPSSFLWQLQRSGEEWVPKRSEQLAQAAAVACGPEHQVAVVAYRRPPASLPVDWAGGRAVDDSDEDAEELGDAAEGAVRAPRSLQQLCEDRLCKTLTPKSFPLLCEVAWELRRPALLDRAFAFLCENAPMLFSRQQLPALAQVPFEALAAFELTALGSLPAPSAALDILDFPLEASLPWPKESSPASVAAPEGAPTDAPPLRRRRRGNLKHVRVPASARAETSAQPQVSGTPFPSGCSPPATPLRSPPRGPPPGHDRPDEWTEVQHPRRKMAGASGSKASPPVSSTGKASPSWGLPTSVSSPTLGGTKSPPATPGSKPMPHAVSLGDFMTKPVGRVAEGPSTILSAALHSAETWSKPEPAERADLRQLLQKEDVEASAPTSAHTPKTAKTEEDTRNSWGLEAELAQKQKGRSVYEIQQEEVEEEAQTRERQEIADIEAMFYALEVAERAESEATSGTATASSTPSPSRQKAVPLSQTKGSTNQQKRPRQRGVNTRDGGWDAWSGSSWSGRSWNWSGGGAWRGGERGGWHSNGWTEPRDVPEGETARWIPKSSGCPAETVP